MKRRRTREKLKMNIFRMAKGKEGDMMMRSSSSGTERALLEKVLPSGQGQTKGLVTAQGIYGR